MLTNAKKSYWTAIVLIILNMIPTISKSSQPWQQWEAFRWAGLEEFRKNKTSAAQRLFEQALAEAKQVQLGSQNQAVSIHDLAQVYYAEGKPEKAECYCKEALGLAKQISSDSPTVMLILQTLEDLKRDARKYNDVAELGHKMDRIANASSDAQIIGVATMEPDGTITLKLRLEGPGGSIGHAIVLYKVSDPDYKNVLMHIGPLKPGDCKAVTPLDG